MAVPLPAVELGEPELGEKFAALIVDGVRVFVSSSLLTEGTLTVGLYGWGPFRHLEVHGAKVFG